MGRVADLVESRDKLIELVLRKTDAHVEGVVRRRGSVELPAARHLSPGVLHLEVIPPLGEGLRSSELDEPKEERGRPENGDGSLAMETWQSASYMRAGAPEGFPECGCIFSFRGAGDWHVARCTDRSA